MTHPGIHMTDAPSTPADNQAPTQPQLRVLAQYVKDLSFENPGAPDTLRPGQPAPGIDLSIDVKARSLGEDTFEVALSISARASRDQESKDVVFIAKPLLDTLVYRAGSLIGAGYFTAAINGGLTPKMRQYMLFVVACVWAGNSFWLGILAERHQREQESKQKEELM